MEVPFSHRDSQPMDESLTLHTFAGPAKQAVQKLRRDSLLLREVIFAVAPVGKLAEASLSECRAGGDPGSNPPPGRESDPGPVAFSPPEPPGWVEGEENPGALDAAILGRAQLSGERCAMPTKGRERTESLFGEGCPATPLGAAAGKPPVPGHRPCLAARPPELTPGGSSAFPDFSWIVRANDRAYHEQFQKRYAYCLKKKKYAGNAIKTAKYNVLTFLPLNLFEQFHRVANLYFLHIILLQTIPEISTLPWFALLFPITILLSIRGIRDLIDDIARHRSDGEINSRPCEILTGESFSKKQWKDIRVGDIVCLRKDSFVPADLLLLSSSEPSSLCYVETMDIDGETNLKYRQALLVTHQELTSVDKLASFDGKVTCEEPNSRLHTFIGTLEWCGETYSLDSEQILLRGCRVRNTEVCYGLVIYAGFDSKIMKNCGKIKLKKTKLNHLMDRIVLLISLALILTSLGLAVGSGISVTTFRQEHGYLSVFYAHTTPAQHAFYTFWGFLILLSFVLPMAMLITFEFIYLVNSCFINWDLEMYYAPKDTPAKARSTSLNDQLGQIQYIFSDKTGTLTQNIMTFKKCCIDGKIYGSNRSSHGNPMEALLSWNKYWDPKLEFYDPLLINTILRDDDPILKEFLRLLALCHTVMVEEKESQLIYQAASPDEEALVSAARNMGYVFLSRTQDTITISELGQERTYKVLALLDFNSVRKRMSVLVRDPEGRIRLYTKGADVVILERLHSDRSSEAYTVKALNSFAEETLRTLCLATKEVVEEEYAQWSKKHHAASVSLQDRAQELDKLLGVTAIEDKLQEGVPETIHLLKRGGMKVWVLTGDKQETAVNIGFASQLLSDDMTILGESEICEILKSSSNSDLSLAGSGEALFGPDSPQRFQASFALDKTALVVTGDFLDKILHATGDEQETRKPSVWDRFRCGWAKAKEDPRNAVEEAFVELATACQAVICCRVTPKQKALIIQMVKRHKNAIALAIGDGANDVNMIKTADIGVGISGQEGMQAVQCSDYALAQFRYLQRLLFVHGRWSYLRICKFLRYFFYKTFAGMMSQIWFAFYTGFTAQPLLEGWFLALYNVFYTSYPVLCMGMFEQDVNAEKSLKFPELYKAGQKDLFFNFRTFCLSFIQGSFVSLASFYIALWACEDKVGVRIVGDYQSFAMIVATSAILTVTVEIILDVKFWTVFSVMAIFLSLVLYCLCSYLTQSFQAYTTAPTVFQFPDASKNALTDPTALLVILLSVIVNTIPSLAIRFMHSITVPRTMSEMAQVRDLKMKMSMVELTSHVRRDSHWSRSSYAFSHKEGYADLISKGASMRIKGPRVCSELNGFHRTPLPGKEGSVPAADVAYSHDVTAQQTFLPC
uniref:phospholipid-transporting ATPase IK n=1 Tax=Euleptes europaea TaxID=460621 RepID=UPI00254207C6|nr:phospholipid-transporting ATPase IK [Euleptes europaea]